MDLQEAGYEGLCWLGLTLSPLSIACSSDVMAPMSEDPCLWVYQKYWLKLICAYRTCRQKLHAVQKRSAHVGMSRIRFQQLELVTRTLHGRFERVVPLPRTLLLEVPSIPCRNHFQLAPLRQILRFRSPYLASPTVGGLHLEAAGN